MKTCECGSLGYDYMYPDGTNIVLCELCATGVFCIGCRAFTGGTENIFIYGPYECSSCHDDYEEYDEYEYDDYKYDDVDPFSGFYGE